MEAARRITRPSLKDELFEKPYGFEFCQAVKILETLFPDAAPLGVHSNPLKEVVSLKSRIAYSYPPSDLYSLKKGAPFALHVMEVNFMGIAGAEGPLPMPYTEKIIQRIQVKDFALQDFLNIFNHRLLSLFYRIRKKYKVGLETVEPENSRLAELLFSCLGLGTPSYRNRLSIPDRSLLAYAGLMWSNTKSAPALTTLLKDYFGLPFDLLPFYGEWIALEKDQQTYLSADNPWRTLGQGAALGTKAWTITRTCMLVAGPLTYQQFKELLPQQTLYKHLKSLVSFYRGLNGSIKLNLVLKKEEIPALRLNGQQSLGWTSWLISQRSFKDDNQVIIK